jgi:hypothetical protein
MYRYWKCLSLSRLDVSLMQFMWRWGAAAGTPAFGHDWRTVHWWYWSGTRLRWTSRSHQWTWLGSILTSLWLKSWRSSFPPFLWPLPYWSMVSWGFVPNNFHGGRMYRTGDMVRFMPLQPWGQLSVDRLPQAARRILNRHWMYAILIRSCKI